MKRKWLIVIIVIVILFIIGATAGWIYNSNQKPKETPAAIEASRTNITNQTEADALKIVNGGGKVTAAAAVYDKAVSAASNDPILKNELLLGESTLYFNGNDYVKALAIAKQSEAITRDDNIEQFIAQIYIKMGDKQNAIKYYNNAIQLVDKSRPMASDDINYYKSQIKQLGGTIN